VSVDDLRATYRLQLLPHLDFDGACELVPYLKELGITHLYLAPSLQARAESTHGYDVVDPTALSEQLGGEAAFRRLCVAGLGVILDVVPNHMAAAEDENPFWRDPLARPKFFDLDWRTGDARRFFDVGDLAGVRVEDPEVFEATHAKIIELVREGLIEGIRIDHLDGLANPTRYLERLREAGIEHVWVEKILEPGEQLRGWSVEGTTGYEFANEVTALFVAADAEEPLTRLYTEFTGVEENFEELAFEAKLEQARTVFDPEVRWLRSQLEDADEELDIAQALASLRTYRTYVDPDTGKVDGLDRSAIKEAQLPSRLADLLLLEERGHDSFVIRFQQTTPPVFAKGVEDTAFYRYNRLLCLNEVGGDPNRFSLSVDEFHAANLERALRFPRQLLASQTHDTKRSGDVRARLAALSWRPTEWEECVLAWHELNASLRVGGSPDANEEYMIYQTLVGAWPLERERLSGYLRKALREAKTNTSWVDQNDDWEQGVYAFAEGLYDHQPFLDSFEPFVERVARDGERISLAQTLLKLTAPGVPDIYQGDELWTFNLVDPDNRRPVDWKYRRALLHDLANDVAPTRETAKLYLTWKTLQLRARRAASFAHGVYQPITASPGICAYMRGDDVLVAVAVAPMAVYQSPAGFVDALGADLGVWLLERV
jgi:(1->4)-alpha-D-glucan 1-alpha-D-glucosylmutase